MLRGIRPVIPADGVSALSPLGYHLSFFQLTSLYRGIAVRSGDGIRFTR